MFYTTKIQNAGCIFRKFSSLAFSHDKCFELLLKITFVENIRKLLFEHQTVKT